MAATRGLFQKKNGVLVSSWTGKYGVNNACCLQWSAVFGGGGMSVDGSDKSVRWYRATERKEIVPLIGLALVLAVGGRYSYRALQRMDEEWQQFQRDVAAHNNRVGPMPFGGGRWGIDLGTVSIRIAHSPTKGTPNVIVDREGARSTPTSVLFDEGQDDNNAIVGGSARDQQWDKKQVWNPRTLLSSKSSDKNIANRATRALISSAATNALERVLGSTNNNNNTASLFDRYDAQPIFTYPPSQTTQQHNNHNLDDYLKNYRDAVSSLVSSTDMAVFVPEPLAAIRGARHYDLFSKLPTNAGTVVGVIDIGGTATSISLVKDDNDEILYHATLENFGGEIVIESLMNYLERSSFFPKHTVMDGMTKRRLYHAATSATMELANSSSTNGRQRVQIQIPFLTMDPRTRLPKHLDMGISRTVWEMEFHSFLRSRIDDREEDGMTRALSDSIDVHDLSTLYTSALMNALESMYHTTIITDEERVNPTTMVRALLIVGGGARNTLHIQGIQTAMRKLGLDETILIIPKRELLEELTVIGATIPPSPSQ